MEVTSRLKNTLWILALRVYETNLICHYLIFISSTMLPKTREFFNVSLLAFHCNERKVDRLLRISKGKGEAKESK